MTNPSSVSDDDFNSNFPSVSDEAYTAPNLLAQTKKGAIGMGTKMKGKRKQQEYVLPSTSDDTGFDSQGSNWTFTSVGTGNWTLGTFGSAYSADSEYLETILRGDDFNYVKQKYGKVSIVVTLLQLFFLTMTIAFCGFAPVNVNPSIGTYPDVLSFVGGTNSYAIFNQFQLWRLVTTPFISAGVIPFLCVAAIQLELGAFFEREWGSTKWLIIYVASSLGSTLLDCTANSEGISVGSSGALVGLFGAKISEVIMLMSFKTKDAYLIDGMHQLSAILFTLFFVSLLLFFPYVEWRAHMGGFVAGFIIGMFVFTKKIKRGDDKKLWFGIGLLLAGIASFILLVELIKSTPSADLADVCTFYENMHPENYDCQCAM